MNALRTWAAGALILASAAAWAQGGREILSRPEPAGAELYEFLLERAEVWRRRGQPARQIADLERAVELPDNSEMQRRRASQLAYEAALQSGSLLVALQHNRRAYDAAVRVAGGRPGPLMRPLHEAAFLHARLGEVPKAQAAVDEMERHLRRMRRGAMWERAGKLWTSLYESARGHLLEVQGRAAEAEQAVAAALQEAEGALKSRIDGAEGEEERAEQALHTGWIERVSRELANLQLVLGKLNEAELTVRHALGMARARAGERSDAMMRTRTQLGRVLVERGRYAAAEEEAREALRIAESRGYGGESGGVIVAREVLGASLVMQQRWEEAARVYAARVEAVAAADPELRSRLGLGSPSWAMALIQTGRLKQAVGLLEAMARRLAEREGEGSFNVAMARGLLAVALLREGERERSVRQFGLAVPVLVERAYLDQKENRDGPARTARLVFVLEGYLRALEEDPHGSAEMFRIADFARGGNVQRALAAGAARGAVRDARLAALIERKDRLESRLAALSATLGELLGAPEDRRNAGAIAELRRELAGERGEVAKLAAGIERDHPEFAGLVAPRPVTLQEAQRALRAGEALVSIYVTEDRTYVWALGSGGSAMSVRPVGAAALAASVGALRKALDVGATPLELFPAYDTATAHRLYRELLEPVGRAWSGARTLVVIPHRALGQLPFSVLLTEAAAVGSDPLPFGGYRRLPWLVKRVALVQLPAAASLVTLAKLPPSAANRRPFIGFGDPVFASGHKLQPLPDTRDEIRDIAVLLKADPDKEVFIGVDASEQRVKTQDLSRHRIVAFATHGLVPGDLEGLAQPALALSSPELAGGTGDGLLGMDEILGLKLDADWVVLSACNTASAGSGAEEAVSGLGRSFFYAGARALLLSNWPVETVSVRLLTTETFRRQAQDAKLPRAEALRQAMLHVMQNETGKGRDGRELFSYAHPMFWAPFSLVGDGN